jgi:hypothetical protein
MSSPVSIVDVTRKALGAAPREVAIARPFDASIARSSGRQISRVIVSSFKALGVTGSAGAGLLLLAGLGAVLLWLPLQRDLTAARAELAAHGSGTLTAVDDRAGLTGTAGFVSQLPTQQQLPMILGQIVGQATAAQLELEKGTYSLATSKSQRVVRYQLVYPVRGTYPAIRKFVDGSLAAVPSLALGGLRMERSTVGAAQLDAEIKFVIFARTAP